MDEREANFQVQNLFRHSKLSVTLQILVSDCVNFCAAGFRSWTALSAENLFLSKRLALFREREKRPRRRHRLINLCCLSSPLFFRWRSALMIVTPPTWIG